MRIFYRLAMLLIATVIAGCANSSSVGPTVSHHTAPLQVLPNTNGADLIWVTNSANHSNPWSLSAYQPGSTGNIFPAQTISGPHTQLNSPVGIVKENGLLYVSNIGGGGGLASINIYPVTSSGDAAPLHTIIGLHTGLSQPYGIAITNTGVIIVLNQGTPSITSYAAGKYGSIRPVRTIEGSNTQLNAPCGISLHNGLMYVTNQNSQQILEFPVGASGNAFPKTLIGGPDTGLAGPCGIAVDKAGNIYVANFFGGSVTEYAPGSQFDSLPVATLSGSNTLLFDPEGIALNTNPDRLYVINGSNQGPDSTALTGYYRPANGNLAPFMDISGSNTGLSGCYASVCNGVAF